MCKSHTKKIGALKLSQQDVGKNCIFRGCVSHSFIILSKKRIFFLSFFLSFLTRNKRPMDLNFFFYANKRLQNEPKQNKNTKNNPFFFFFSFSFFFFLFLFFFFFFLFLFQRCTSKQCVSPFHFETITKGFYFFLPPFLPSF